MESSIDILWPSLLKLVAATICGGIIGLEREIHGRAAGLRTNALVCLASCLLIIVSRTGALFGMDRSAGFVLNIDPARMAAGIVTGIGFLGAGAILRVKDNLIRGLTTAAGIWFVAAVGVAIGLNSYFLAGGATVIALVVLDVLNRVERGIEPISYRTLEVDVATEHLTAAEKRLDDLLSQNNVIIQQASYNMDNESAETRLTLAVRTKSSPVTSELLRGITCLQGVRRVSWT